MAQTPGQENHDNVPPVKRFAFLLVDNFTLLAFSSAIEPLRLANYISDKQHYSWRILSEDGAAIRSSGGLTIAADGGLEDLPRDYTIIVVGGRNIKQSISKPILTWLRRESRKGMTIGAVCTGAQVLATAGLLDGKMATIHWDNRDSFAEEFPEVDLLPQVFVMDGNRITSSGGTTPSDMILKLIAKDHGPKLANAVADQMIHTTIRGEKDEQRLSIPTRIGVRHPKLSTVIKMMEENIEDPISPSVLASDVGMSTRQLERLFRRYLNRSPKRYYMEIRLKRARNLLMQTDMSVINVALACGFASPSHFSKCYRAHFGTTPYRERGAHAEPV